MAKQLNVNLAFTADTGKARAEIQALQNSLTQLAQKSIGESSSLGFSKEIKEAQTAIAQLKAQLSSSVSSNGLLDLTQFNSALQSSGMTLETYRAKLSALGPEGTAAFSQLAASVASAEIPIKRANGLLSQFSTTLMNTARWQLSSSLLHGFIGSIRSAYGYAKDLNESLNNIRIVTGYSSDDMAVFAEQANKAAQSLSTTTTKYTDAALIYYQQGIRDQEEIAQRVETTVKLANVSKQSAEQVSDQMTAIWNNFDDGTKSLEYYADVITALGASTASSSEEISKGIEKFAAVADTVGLSYENAAAALATIVSTTRQSADTVGTGLRTLFSRLQSLKLGETLEDGVGLSKYSAALESVGVQVLDINGHVRDMDDILGDLGEKWGDIGKEQQIALAQTVGGVRQYTNLIALMDNWDKMQTNVQTALDSEGTLQEQQDIYAESWEAASKRVKAAAQEIYASLINEDFFIGFDNILTKILNSISSLIKGFGGLPGTLATVGALLTNIFSQSMINKVDQMAKNIAETSKKGQAAALARQQEAIGALQKEASLKGNTLLGKTESESLKTQATLQETLLKNQSRYNEEQVKTAQNLLDQNTSLREQAIEAAKIAEQAQLVGEREEKRLLNMYKREQSDTQEVTKMQQYTAALQDCIVQQSTLSSSTQTLNGILKGTFDSPEQQANAFRTTLEGMLPGLQQLLISSRQADEQGVAKLTARIIKMIQSFDGSEAAMKKIVSSLDTLSGACETGGNNLEGKIKKALEDIGITGTEAERIIRAVTTAFEHQGDAAADAGSKLTSFKNQGEGAANAMNNMKTAALSAGQQFQAVASFSMSLASVINSVKSAIDTLNNDDLTFGEKMLQIIPSLLMSFSMLSTAMMGTRGAALLTAASHVPLLGSFAAGTVGAEGFAAANVTLSTTLVGLLPIIGAIGAAIGIVSGIMAYWDHIDYSFDEKMEDAKAATEATAKAAETAKTKYEGVASALDQYHDAIEVLDSCTTGTDAWREALEKVSTTIGQITDQYPELKKFYDASTGQFDQEAIDKYLETLDKQRRATEFQNIYTPTTVEKIQAEQSQNIWEEAQEEIDQLEFHTMEGFTNLVSEGFLEILTDIKETDTEHLGLKISDKQLQDAGISYDLEDTVNARIPQQTVGAYKEFLSALLTETSQLSDLTKENYPDKLKEVYETSENEAIVQMRNQMNEYLEGSKTLLENLELSDDQIAYVAETWENSLLSQLSKYAEKMVDSEVDTRTYEGTLNEAFDNIVNSIFMELGDTIDPFTQTLLREKLKQAIKEQSQYSTGLGENFDHSKYPTMDVSGRIGSASIRAQDSYYMTSGHGEDSTNPYDIWQQKLTQRYIKVSGDNLKWTGEISGNDTNRAYKFSDLQGENERYISVEEMASAIALFENGVESFDSILEEVGSNVKDYFGKNTSDELISAIGQGLQNPKEGISLGNVKVSDLQSVLKEGEEYKDWAERITNDMVKKQEGDTLEEQEANFEKTFGQSSADFLKMLNSAFDTLDTNLSNLISDNFLNGTTKDQFQRILDAGLGNESLETQTLVKDQFQQLYLSGGKNLREDLVGLYESAGDKISELAQIDFSSYDSLEDLQNALIEVGLDSVASSDGLINVYDALRNVGEVSLDASANIAEINKVISKLSKGDTVSAEDFESLKNFDPDIANEYFTKMADGTWKLIGDADKFQKTVNQASLEKLTDQFRAAGERSELIAEKAATYSSAQNYAKAGQKYLRTEQDEKGNNIQIYQQDHDILKDQIQFLHQIGELTDQDTFKMLQLVRSNQDLDVDQLDLIQKGLENISKEWETINDKIDSNKLLTDEEISQVMSLMPNLKSLYEYVSKNQDLFQKEGESFEDTWSRLANIFRQNFGNDSSNISTLKDYKTALQEVNGEISLTKDAAKEAWKNMDPSQFKISDLSFIKSEFEAGRMGIQEFNAALEGIAGNVDNLKDLNKLLDENISAQTYSQILDEILDKEGVGTLRALREIKRAIDEGKASAELMGSIMDRILGATDITDAEKYQQILQQNQDTHVETKYNGSMLETKEVKNVSDKDAGMGLIKLASESTEMFDDAKLDMFNEGLAKIGDTADLSAMEVREIGKASTEIMKDSDFFSLDEKVENITDSFKNGDKIDPSNIKAYADSVKDLVMNDKDLDLDQKLQKIDQLFKNLDIPEEYLNPEKANAIISDESLDTSAEKIAKLREVLSDDYVLEHYNELIKELLDNDNSTTAQKVAELNSLLSEGLISAKHYNQQIDDILNDSSVDSQTKLNIIDNNQEQMKEGYFKEHRQDLDQAVSEGMSETFADKTAQTQANMDLLERYQNVVNELSTESFDTPEQLIEFFDRLPEGVEYTDKLNALMKDMASSVTSFDQLDKFGELMTANGATTEDLQDENGVYQAARQSAIDSTAKDMGVSSEEFSNYINAVQEMITADNELRQAQMETAEGMQQLDNLCLKMAESMMRQEEGFEDLGSAIKKYSQELGDFANGIDTMSVKSNKALTAVQQACEKLFGVKVSRKFVEENLKDIQEAAEGSEEALKRLQKVVAKDFVSSLKLAEKESNKLTNAIDDIGDAEIGDDISDDFRNTLNEMLANGTMTADQIESLLNGLGYDVNFDGMSMAVDNAREIVSQFGPMISEGIDIASAEFGQAMAGLSSSARAELQALVQDFMNAGMDAGQAYNAAINSISTELEVHDKEVQMQDNADAASHSSVDLSGDITASADNGPGTSTHYSGHMDIDTTTTAAGDGDIHIPTLGKGGAAYNGGGAGAGARSGAGSGGGGGCFASGTLISILNGYKNIENIKIGDVVLSYNEITKKNEYSEVLQTMVHFIKNKIYTLRIENESIVVTGIHRFYIYQKGWIPVSELKINDLVQFADGTLHNIQNIKIEIKVSTVYNFEVSNNHNYYVGNNQILVHNKGGCFSAGTLIYTQDGYKNIENIKVGDIVLSYNEITGKNEYSPVLQKMIHFVKDNIYTLFIENEQIVVTGVHRFYINRNNNLSWISAAELQKNDYVLFADGSWHIISDIKIDLKILTVYNFEVANNHNYYITQSKILVHNKGCFIAGTQITMQDYYKNIENVKPGDIVLSFNESTGKNEYSEVIQVMNHFVKEEIYTLHIENEIIVATGIHKFLITYNNQITMWVPASELKVGDYVQFADGTLHQISQIDIEFKIKTVYNFEVSNNHNYYVGKNQVLVHNKGGGGGSGKKKETKDKKKADDEIERYHVIKEQIDDVSRTLDKLSKAKDRAWGPQRIKMMNQEIQKQKTMNEHTKAYIKEIEGYLKTDRAAIASYGAAFDSQGNITNYKELMQQQLDIYNAAIEAYNNSAQEDADKETLEAAEKAYEEFKKKLEKYEETNNLLQEQKQVLDEGLRQVYDLVTEKNEYAIQIRIDFDDDQLKYFEFLDKYIDHFNEGLGAMAEKMANFNDKSATLIDKNNAAMKGINATLDHYFKESYMTASDGSIARDANGNAITVSKYAKQNGVDLNALKKKVTEGGELTEIEKEIMSNLSEKEWEMINGYRDTLMENAEAMMELMQDVVDTVADAFDELADQMDKSAKPIERAASALENYASIIDIVGQDMLGVTDELMMRLNQSTIDVAHSATVAAQAKLEAMQAAREDTKRLLDQAIAEGDEAMANKWQKALDEMDEKIDDAIADRDAKLQAELQSAREAYEKTTEIIKNNLLDAFAGPENTWAQLKDDMDYAKEAAERFVPEYQKIYELSKLNRDINKSIDDTDNIKNKQALRDLQKEINKLSEEGVEVSQYDLDNARRQYELELARLELEESKNVKDTVRLSKDSEGNWSYIYTADENDVAQAEQNYEDKLYAMQQANADYINKLQDDITRCEEEYAEKLAEIMNDQTLTEEQRNAAVEKLNAHFSSQMDYLTSEADKAVNNNKVLYDKDWAWYSEYTEEKAGLDTDNAAEMAANNIYRLGDQENFITDWNQTFLGMETGYNTAEGYQEAMQFSAEQATGQMNMAYDNFAENTDRALSTVNTSIDNFAQTMETDMEKVVDSAKQAEDATVQMGEEAAEAFDKVISQAEKWQEKYSSIMNLIIEKNNLVIKSIQEVSGALTDLEDTHVGTDDSQQGDAPETQGQQDNAGNGSNNGGKPNLNWDRIYAAYRLINSGAVGNDPERKQNLYNRGYTKDEARAAQLLINYTYPTWDHGWGMSWEAGKNKLRETYSFETGGYTGDWNGSAGQLAVLHSKELVLNKEDTSNILSAVEIIRKLSSVIDLNAKAAEYTVGNLQAIQAHDTNSQIEQTVTITAEFPNATNRDEIAEAFKTLVNEASQYANRKNF